MAGAFGKCATCKGDITVPGVPLSGVRRPLTPNDSIVDMPAIKELGSEEAPDDPLAAGAFPRPKPAAANQICGICQTPIETFEATETCPACSQRYHAECWSQNRGCAAYGCTHVGVLDAAEDMSLVAAAVTQQAPKSARLVRPAPAPGFSVGFCPAGRKRAGIHCGRVHVRSSRAGPGSGVSGVCDSWRNRTQEHRRPGRGHLRRRRRRGNRGQQGFVVQRPALGGVVKAAGMAVGGRGN